jgi:hypothetical protein
LPRLRAAHRCNSVRDINVALDQILEKVGKAGNAAETAYAVLREAIDERALRPARGCGDSPNSSA